MPYAASLLLKPDARFQCAHPSNADALSRIRAPLNCNLALRPHAVANITASDLHLVGTPPSSSIHSHLPLDVDRRTVYYSDPFVADSRAICDRVSAVVALLSQSTLTATLSSHSIETAVGCSVLGTQSDVSTYVDLWLTLATSVNFI